MITFRSGVLSAAIAAAAVSFGIAGKAHATPLDLLDPGNTLLGIYLKDFPSGLNEHQIDLSGGTGTTVTGNVQGVPGTPLVNFTSPSSLDAANGFANICATAQNCGQSGYNKLTITVPATSTYTGAFGDFLFDVQLRDPGKTDTTPPLQLPFNLTISAYSGPVAPANLLGTLTLTDANKDLKTNADLSFLLLAETSTLISNVVLESSDAGFKELKHFQISDLQLVCTENCGGGGPGLATPLPAALPLFAGGLGVIGLLARRRKRKSAAIAD